MGISTISSREFNQKTAAAMKMTENGPVFITERGEPAYVLLTFSDYQQLTGQQRNIQDTLAMSGVADIDFSPQRTKTGWRDVDLS